MNHPIKLRTRAAFVPTSLCHILLVGGLSFGTACSKGEENNDGLFGGDGSIPGTTGLGGDGMSGGDEDAGMSGGAGESQGKDSSNDSGMNDDGEQGGSADADSDSGAAESNDDEAGDEDGASGPKFDVENPDAGDLPGSDEEVEVSYIWIANSAEGTVSKINTRTVEEEGRYWVHSSMDASTNPSRTTVDLNGDVAVALRGAGGGVTKFAASRSRCDDRNDDKRIVTSGSKIPLDYDKEECRLWHTEFGYAGQRGIAWTHGVLDPETGKWTGQDVWVTSFQAGGGVPTEAFLLDGDTGDIVKQVTFGPEHMREGAKLVGRGGYGGAVDSKGGFWFTPKGGFLGHVTLDTFEATGYPLERNTYGGGYGITVDSEDIVWTCAQDVGRFDPATETWQLFSFDMGAPEVLSNAVMAGCMVDTDKILWHVGSLAGREQGIYGFDTVTLKPVIKHALPATIRGVSIDIDGFVWAVEFGGKRAFRVDPKSGAYKAYEELVGAYTYSDMTGFALRNTLPPGVG